MFSTGNDYITEKIYRRTIVRGGKKRTSNGIYPRTSFPSKNINYRQIFPIDYVSVGNIKVTNGFFWQIMFPSEIKSIPKIKDPNPNEGLNEFAFGDFQNPSHSSLRRCAWVQHRHATTHKVHHRHVATARAPPSLCHSWKSFRSRYHTSQRHR